MYRVQAGHKSESPTRKVLMIFTLFSCSDLTKLLSCSLLPLKPLSKLFRLDSCKFFAEGSLINWDFLEYKNTSDLMYSVQNKSHLHCVSSPLEGTNVVCTE